MRRETELLEGWEYTAGESGEDFRPVTLPHDAAIEREFDRRMDEGGSQGFRNRFLVCRYRRKLHIQRMEPGHRWMLNFGGIYEDSTVRVNGREAGGHKYGYSSFTLDVTELLQEGENLLEVRADNSQHPADRWYSGAGLYRSVKLIEVEEVHFEPWDVVLRTEVLGDAARVTVCTGLEEEQLCGRKVRAELAAQTGATVAAAEGSCKELELTVEKAEFWSAEAPNLYRLTLSLWEENREADRLSLSVGLRTIEMVPGKGMFVNGNKVMLKGVCLHQDVGCLGIAARKEIFRQRLLALKEMGCNAIRPAHHTFSSEFLDLCDELGFYVYEECFDKWHGGLYGRYFRTEWKKDVDAMVRRDRNRPSIFMWGVGNEVENQGQGSMLATLKLLTEYVRTLDARPVSYAMNPHFKREDRADLSGIKDIQKFVDEVNDTEIYDKEERVERIAGIAEYVDVVSCNYQEQWYPLIHERIPNKLILGTEVYQYFMGAPDQMQNFTDVNPVAAVQDLDYCIGSFIWTGIDYLGESMGWPAKGWGGSLIRTNGSRRPGYYLMQSYWDEKPMVHFSVMDYSLEDEGVKEHWDIPMLADHWHFSQFHKTVIPYCIMSNCEEVQLFLNGKRFYIPHPAECRNRMITGYLPWQPGTVEAVGLTGGKEVCRHTVRTPGMAVALKFEGDAWTFKDYGGTGLYGEEISLSIGREQDCLPAGKDQECMSAGREQECLSDGRNQNCQATGQKPGEMRISAEKGRQVQLAVRAYDGEGNPCFRESAKVRFRVEGPAEILAVDAGEITGNEPYQGNAVHLFRGQASVMIALTGETGRVCIYADAEGMRTGNYVLLAE